MTKTEELIAEREKTHGNWAQQSYLAQQLKGIIAELGVAPRNDMQREALEMICVKISRICTGNPNKPDHWDDIAGYAMLGKAGHE